MVSATSSVPTRPDDVWEDPGCGRRRFDFIFFNRSGRLIGLRMRYFRTAATNASSAGALGAETMRFGAGLNRFGWGIADAGESSSGLFTDPPELTWSSEDCGKFVEQVTLSDIRWSSSVFFWAFLARWAGSSGATSESEPDDDDESLEESETEPSSLKKPDPPSRRFLGSPKRDLCPWSSSSVSSPTSSESSSSLLDLLSSSWSFLFLSSSSSESPIKIQPIDIH